MPQLLLLHYSDRVQEDGTRIVTDGTQHTDRDRHLSPVLKVLKARGPRHPEPEGIQTAGGERAAKLPQGRAWSKREEQVLSAVFKEKAVAGNVSVIPATQEAEAGGSPEPRSSRLAWTTQQDPISRSK